MQSPESETPNIKKLQDVLLELLIELDRICTKHKINYSISFGTLIGAVRHAGFIPWDDDADIIMTRENYDKFCKICATELSDGCFLQTKDSDKKYPYNISRLRKDNTTMIYEEWKKAGFHQGLYIDIFPCDEIPDSLLKRCFQKWVIVLTTMVRVSRNREIFLNRKRGKFLLRKIMYIFLRFVPKEIFDRIEYQIITKYNSKSNNKIGIICEGGILLNTPKKRKPFNTYVFNRYDRILFEGYNLMTVSSYEALLDYWYGDYMKLPPVNERVMTHRPLVWDVNKSYQKYIDDC